MDGLPAESLRCAVGTVVGHAPAASVDHEASVFRVELHSRSITRLDAGRQPIVGTSMLTLVLAVCATAMACDSKSADNAPSTATPHSLAVSPSHSCALRAAGLYCWGDNFLGQLGNGDTTASELAVAASVLRSDVAEVAAASGRTCVRTRQHTIECWGANDRGQVGDGTRTDTLTPVAATGINDAIALALDEESTCVLRERGRTVACWGGGSEQAWVPRQLAGLSDIRELRAGSTGHYCARDASDAVWCWSSADGKWEAPVKVEALTGALAIAVPSYNAVCALVEAGNVVCHDTENGRSVALGDSDDVVTINAAGGLALCGNKRDGRWYCWNVLPQMLETVGSPAIAVPSDVLLSELLLSGLRACALREDGQVVCASANELLIGANGIDPAGLKVVEGLPD
jgi:Regulator of chromosome condensation (RCC1) repeat